MNRGMQYLLPCVLAASKQSCILEAINLTLFELVNEDIDQKLKMTGCSLMLLTAGAATYKVNPDIISPTKGRCILGGLPVHLISFA